MKLRHYLLAALTVTALGIFGGYAFAASAVLSMDQNGAPVTTTANDLMVSAGNSQLQDEQSATIPVYASGGCTTTPTITGSPWAFTLTNGATGCSGNTITLTLPAAGNNGKWVCDAHDITSPTTTMVEQSAAASGTSVVFTNYTRTTGVVLTWVGSDVILVKCAS